MHYHCHMDTDKAKMLGKTDRGFCSCCRDEKKVQARRTRRRRERQAVARIIRLTY